MPRLPRRYQIEKSLIFHVLNRGIIKQTIFNDADGYVSFIKTVKHYIKEAAASIYHWCLMPNHYHILIELSDPSTLSKIVGGWQQVYAVRYHHRHNTAGRLFQGRFKSQAIEKERYLLSCGRYVELNPVRAGLCQFPWEWPWSSAKFYVEGKRDLLTTYDPCWKDREPKEYREWLLAGCTEDEEKLFRGSSDSIGGEGFRNELRLARGRLKRRGKGRRSKRQTE
jgi:putative transposase